MSDKTGNTCNIVTIIPMEVECNVTNASTNLSFDGSASVFVNGGTPPYSIVWSNGQFGNTITNLSASTYSATVVDYYGDYTAVTECVVGYNTFYLSKLDDCRTGTPIYVTGQTFESGKIYTFSGLEPCYEYDTNVLHTSQTYSGLTISEIYDTCEECQVPEPTPPAQGSLCLSNDGTTQYTFTPAGTDGNGNFYWENVGNTLTMVYNTNGYWEVTPWTNVGSGTMRLNQSVPSTYPLGTWENYGVPRAAIWTVTQGACSGVPLSVIASPTDPSCVGENGSVQLTAQGGATPYQYSIQGIANNQPTGLFNGLPPGTYTGIVQDNNNNTANVTFTIGVGSNSVNYVIGLTNTTITSTPNPTNNSITKSYNYNVTVTPPLPPGVTVDFKLRLNHTREKSGYQPNSNSVQFSNTFTVLVAGSNWPTTDSAQVGTLGNPCGDNTGSITTYNTTSNLITIGNTFSVNGTVTTTVDLNTLGDDCNCPTRGDYNTSLSVIDVSINGDNCTSASAFVGSINMDTERQGCKPQTYCNRYELQNTSDFLSGTNALFSYTDCDGINQVDTVTTDRSSYVCAQSTPNVVSGPGQVYLISSNCT